MTKCLWNNFFSSSSMNMYTCPEREQKKSCDSYKDIFFPQLLRRHVLRILILPDKQHKTFFIVRVTLHWLKIEAGKQEIFTLNGLFVCVPYIFSSFFSYVRSFAPIPFLSFVCMCTFVLHDIIQYFIMTGISWSDKSLYTQRTNGEMVWCGCIFFFSENPTKGKLTTIIFTL